MLVACLVAMGMNELFTLFDPLEGALDFPFEFLSGMISALPFVVVLGFGEMFGELFDTQRGQNFSSIYDPIHQSSGSQSSHLIKTYLTIRLVVGNSLGEGIALVAGSSSSGRVSFGEWCSHIGMQLTYFLSAVGRECLLLFLPVAATLLFVDFGIAVLGKLLPQVSLVPESFAVKAFLGFALLLTLLSSGAVESLSVLVSSRI